MGLIRTNKTHEGFLIVAKITPSSIIFKLKTIIALSYSIFLEPGTGTLIVYSLSCLSTFLVVLKVNKAGEENLLISPKYVPFS